MVPPGATISAFPTCLPARGAAKAGVDREAGYIYLSDAFLPLFRPLGRAWGGGYEDDS